jgi:hypothetical protein
MQKKEYQTDKDVIDFIKFLIECSKKFNHSYINRRTKEIWSCKGIDDAYRKYNWPFKNSKNETKYKYSDNELELNRLSNKLKSAYMNKNIEEIFNYSKLICKWGGVLGGEKKGNLKTLLKNKKELLNKYEDTEKAMCKIFANDQNLGLVFNMNAGFTKIYSLLFDKLIIYDSRVGAALCYLVKKYCEKNKIKKIPDLLKFSWSKAKESKLALNPKNRNPGDIEGDKFPDFNVVNKLQLHAKSMLTASWLIEKYVITRYGNNTKYLSKEMRKFEAALFMIGYDLPIMINFKNQISNQNKNIYDFTTNGKKLNFCVYINDDGIRIKGERKSSDFKFTYNQLDEIRKELILQFDYDLFPLSVDGNKINKKIADPGLGMTLNKISKKPHHSASFLGPFLQAIGALKYLKGPVISWKVNKDNFDVSIKQLVDEYYNN